jgi:hypothetical protein
MISRVLLLTLLTGCARPSASEAPTPEAGEAGEGLRLVASAGQWFVSGFGPDAAAMLEQGRLFAVTEPIDGTEDARPIAVMRALGPAQGRSVQVAAQCIVPGAVLTASAGVVPLSSQANVHIGPCLARVVEVAVSERGETYVILDVGRGVGVQEGDQYLLLGRAVSVDGHVPLGLDTDGDGLCQVPADPMHLKDTTTRCIVVESPSGCSPVENSFAAWMQRSEQADE